MAKTKKQRRDEKRELLLLKKEIKNVKKGEPPIVYRKFPHRNTFLKRCLSEKARTSNLLLLSSLTSFRQKSLGWRLEIIR